MRTGKFTGGVFGLFALGLLFAGCSGNETIISKGYSGGEGTLSYFPLNEGYTTTFEVRSNGNTWLDTYRVGGEKMIQSGMATWRVKSSGSTVDTGYFQGSSEAIYYYPTASSGSERILQAPLNVGQSWDRYASGGDTGGGGTGGDGGAQTAPGHFPTGGSNVMIVRGTETIYLSNGAVYTSALKICTQEVNGYENRYWFVQGIGLVKYVLAVSGSLATGEGQTVGELVSFGY